MGVTKKSSLEDKPLSDRQRNFCREYIKDYNGKQAVIRAGYSKAGAKEIASRLLTYANVQNFLSELKVQHIKKQELSVDMVLSELKKIGFSDISDIVNISGESVTIKDINVMPEGASRLINSINITKTKGEDWDSVKTSVKLHDKLSALEKIAKYLGMYERDNKQKGSGVQIDPSKYTTDELIQLNNLLAKGEKKDD